VSTSVLGQPVGVQNYRVTAVFGGVEGPPSNIASKTILPPTPAAPGNLTFLEQIVAWIRSWFGRHA
jgi:hypothetical protein